MTVFRPYVVRINVVFHSELMHRCAQTFGLSDSVRHNYASCRELGTPSSHYAVRSLVVASLTTFFAYPRMTIDHSQGWECVVLVYCGSGIFL
jgi:hypothetical protein